MAVFRIRCWTAVGDTQAAVDLRKKELRDCSDVPRKVSFQTAETLNTDKPHTKQEGFDNPPMQLAGHPDKSAQTPFEASQFQPSQTAYSDPATIKGHMHDKLTS